MGIERKGLGHIADIARASGSAGYILATQQDLATVWALQTGQQTHQHRFTTAGRAIDHGEITRFDRQGDIVEDCGLGITFG